MEVVGMVHFFFVTFLFRRVKQLLMLQKIRELLT